MTIEPRVLFNRSLKQKPKKTKKTVWDIEGYYFDGKKAYTYLRSKKDFRKTKKVEGII